MCYLKVVVAIWGPGRLRRNLTALRVWMVVKEAHVILEYPLDDLDG